MVRKHKKRLLYFLTQHKIAAILIAAIAILSITGLSFYPSTSYAIGNCPGTEQQGDGSSIKPDANKCYSTTPTGATPTANVPTGATTTNTDQATSGSNNQADSTDKGTTCAIEKVGWMLCPIMESMAKISDKMFDVLANNFLRTDPGLVSDNSGTKTAWEIARNLANIMFIVAFLVIIFSQVTSKGITNYGIKKMLPRLIVAAIAVNVSYYICQLAVDITNILGYEIQNALVGIANGIGPSVFGSASAYAGTEIQSTAGNVGTGILTVIIGAALATATVVWLIIGPAAAVITVVLITVLSIVIILILRKALIVLLIVVSPIAFVLYLLPNTEKFFNKWLSMFGKLLMVFPVVGLLFGAGQLASTIILVSNSTMPPSSQTQCDPDNQNTATQKTNSNNRTDYSGNCDGYITLNGGRDGATTPGLEAKGGGTAVSWTTGLVAMGIAVVPLVAVYAVLKGALSAAGAIGGWINSNVAKGRGAARKAASGSDDRRKKRLETSALGNSSFGRGVNIATLGSARRRAGRKAINTSLDRELNMAQLDYTSRRAMENEGFQRQLAGGSRFIPGSANPEAMNRAEANAIAQQRELQAKEIAAAHTTVDRLDPGSSGDITGGAAGHEARLEISAGNFDSPRLAALLEHLGRTNQQAFMQLASQVTGRGDRGNNASRAAAGVMSSMGVYGGGDVARMQNGQNFTDAAGNAIGLREQALQNIINGGLSPAELAKMSNDGLRTVDDITTGNAPARLQVRDTFARMTVEQRNNLSGDKLTRLSGF